MRERDDEIEGLGGARESLEGPWQWWPVVVVEEEKPLRFFDDFAIC